MNPDQHTSRFARWALIVGIVIVLNLFFNYTISLVYKAPAYPTAPQIVGDYTTKESCIAVGGQWNENIYPTPDAKSAPKGYCDPEYTARMQYEQARKDYARSVFIILMILGVIAIALGVLAKNAILSPAFAWGGVLSLIIASMRYWSDADNLVKVILLGLALCALIWLAIKKFAK